LKQKPEGWHIHIHIIADAPYIPYQHLFSTWRKLINCSVPQVTIIAAKTPQQQKYVAKYAAKAADYDGTTDVVAWYEATKGARLWATFGTWYNATLDDLLNVDTPEPPPRQCPRCGGDKGIFYARDGPFLFKTQEWNRLKGTWLEDGESVYQEIAEWKEALGNALGI
jgi:hypothetical protein